MLKIKYIWNELKTQINKKSPKRIMRRLYFVKRFANFMCELMHHEIISPLWRYNKKLFLY
jgi:hypothetical protein